MFRGYFEHNINNQGRVSLPSCMRSVLKEDFKSNRVVMVGLPDHIEVYPEQAYRKIESTDIDLTSDDPRVFQYLVVAHYNVFPTEIDGNGRILLPQKLRNDLGLEREVVIVGLMNRILIFHPEQWSSFLGEAMERHPDNSMVVSKLRNPRNRGE